jgi:hypothetical protein
VFIANGYRCHDIVNRHATLFTVAVEEAALSYQMLSSISQQDVFGAVESLENRLSCAIVELAGFVWSFETK